jgi:hypothetical protein
MYSDWAGITVIRDDKVRDSLSLSRDRHEDHIAVLLHTPEVGDHEHSHIELNKEQATSMRDWLDAWLKDDLDSREAKDDKEAAKRYAQSLNKTNNPQCKEYEK